MNSQLIRANSNRPAALGGKQGTLFVAECVQAMGDVETYVLFDVFVGLQCRADVICGAGSRTLRGKWVDADARI